MQYDANKRASWDQIKRHDYLANQPTDLVPLQILFEESKSTDDIEYRDNNIIINTRDPSSYLQVYERVVKKYVDKYDQESERRITRIVSR